MNMRTSLIAAGITLCLAGTAEAQGSLAGTLDATLELESACTISGDTAISGVNFGVLDFGVQPATFIGELTANATGGAGISGPTQILCSPDIEDLSVAVGPGQNVGEGASIGTGQRALASANSNYVPYDVYVDAGFNTVYPTTGSRAFEIPQAGAAFNLPIYGRIYKTNTAALPAETYTDQLVVTITF